MKKKVVGKLKMKYRKKNIGKRRTSKRPTSPFVGKPDYSMGKENYMKPLSEDERENVNELVCEQMETLIPKILSMDISEREMLKERTNNIWKLLNVVEKYFRKYPDELTLKEFHELESSFFN